MTATSPVRLAILGCGGYAGAHARRLRDHGDARIVALCDVSTDITQTYLQRHLADYQPAPAQFDDPAAMYREADLDAVVICTPHTLHAQHARQALEAGCHVYLEKPMVTSVEDAYALAEQVEQTGRVLVVGYNTPCTPEFDYIRQSIREQRLGRLEMVVGHLAQDWMQFTIGKWRQDPALSGGGMAYDSGAHLLNSLVWSVESHVAEVFAFLDNHGTAVDINSAINVRFENGVLAVLGIAGNCPAGDSHLSFLFDNGRINTNGWHGRWLEVWQGNERVKYPHVTGAAQTADDNFIDAILGRAEPRTNVQHGIYQSELMDAIYEAARTGAAARPGRRATA